MAKLTRRLIDATAPGDCELVLRDSAIAGFHCRISPGGTKTFSLYYRTVAGRERRLRLGRAGEISLEAARDLARELLVEVRRGGDPAGDRRALRDRPTVVDLAQRYMTEHAEVRKKPRSIANDRSMWSRHVLPRWASRPVAEISRGDVTALHHGLRETPYQANRVVELVSKAMNLAEIWGWRPEHSNPARHVDAYRESRRRRVLDHREVHELGQVIDAYLRYHSHERRRAAVLVALLLLTGARRGEIMGARWDWVEADRGVLALPDTKTGPAEIGLPGAAVALLGWWRARAPASDWVIPGAPGKPLQSPRRALASLFIAAGLPDVKLHDLRRTFTAAGLQGGLSLAQVGLLLNHVSAQTTRGYSFLEGNPRRAAVEVAAEAIPLNLSVLRERR